MYHVHRTLYVCGVCMCLCMYVCGVCIRVCMNVCGVRVSNTVHRLPVSQRKISSHIVGDIGDDIGDDCSVELSRDYHEFKG